MKNSDEKKIDRLNGPEIVFRNITKDYPNGVRALDNVSFRVAPGEFAFLMGHSGSGKSSLIRLLMMEERPTEGSITVGNIRLSDIKDSGIPYYRREVGVVFQDFRIILGRSVYENIASAMEMLGEPKKKIDDRVDTVLDTVGILSKKNEKAMHLSGGELQRVAIARAIVLLPGLIIADEPTGNLDPENSKEIMRLLKEINNMGATVLVATHEAGIVENSGQRVISLAHGMRQFTE
ncbi:MAG: ATP-binding cassette domain-containing protein [Clostridia bacterium]|jgi:cell division transport system ATP-binding protein|nr:ATP-binding cassette domain-containing protein [Clostridia bacterium]MBO7399192.1 ATP-binding cassette domain-containing protein [Clostridia bacterium]MBO7503309.1 ATP-binding cassette domain-containing protein [Clostridia bacterium]MBO7658536.1 ATP-binding cassette domain-containing protein [Clostridia bacterium]MBP5666060.1 ATP-binding cassette domain-containing protein [Clostridia bacterium]